MTPAAVGFLTRALMGVKGQAKKLSLFDPDPQLMAMATLTDNASFVVGDCSIIMVNVIKAAGITFKEEAWARIGNMFEINDIRREHWDYVADKSRECVSVLQCNKAPINAPHGHHQQYRLHLGKEMKGIGSVTSYEDQGPEDAVMDVEDSVMEVHFHQELPTRLLFTLLLVL